jgi:hypothetical protein
VLAAIAKTGRVLVTANGKPRAIMIPTSEATFAEDLALLDRMSLAKAVASIRADAVLEGTDAVTASEIDSEIAAARAARRSG